MSPSNSPPCFNIILIDHSAPYVEIPREFVRKHLKNKIPKDPVIQSANGGYCWKLKIQKIDGNYCFAHGWKNVVKDINLGFGDFLYFLRVDQSTFKMFVYGLDGCEKQLPKKINVDVDDDSEDVIVDDDSEDVIVDDDVVEDGDDDVEDEDDEMDDEEVDNGMDDDDEVDNGMDDDDEDEFDDDDDDDDEDDDDDNKEVEDDDEDTDDDDDEDDIDADIDGDDGDPFFTITITRTHKNVLRLKPVFLGLAGIYDERPITIKNSDEEEWPMELRFDKTYKRWHLTSEWCAFARNNNLAEGDRCVFKFIKSEDKLCLAKVTKKRSATRSRRKIPAKESSIERGSVDVESEDEGAKVVKRSRGRPPKRRRGTAAQQKNGGV